MVGKPNQIIPKAPLHPIPAIGEHFSRILIDCVGPLPKTKAENQYNFILTIMCVATRFPEAIPLRNIRSKTIVKTMIKVFTLFSLPRSVQSDQGSNFMSSAFQQVMYELGIKQYKPSACHPESQRAIERFHQTLKTMVKIYCFDNDRGWDDGNPLLMFAARESVQESTGFSPFELGFDHSVRGPLKLLKEKFLSEEEEVNLLQYVLDFTARLVQVGQLARENLVYTQRLMKYDKRVTDRKFNPGDKVLVHGKSYTIEEMVSSLNYVVTTPDRRKRKQICHVNMLKLYVDRDDTDNTTATKTVCPVTQANAQEESINDQAELHGIPKHQNSDILLEMYSKLSHLPPYHLESLIDSYTQLFPDVPCQTGKIYHDVDVGDASPIKQYPYRMSPLKKKYLQKEVQYLLDNNLIEPS